MVAMSLRMVPHHAAESRRPGQLPGSAHRQAVLDVLGYTLGTRFIHHADPVWSDGYCSPLLGAPKLGLAAPRGRSSSSPSSSARRVEPALGLAVRPDLRLINRLLSDLGLIDKPIQFLGVDADLSTWSIIASVTWKVIGFGMILFVAAIQAIPSEINEATMVDGATFWQRTRRVTCP
jgi:hypothetical protein